MKSYGWNRMGSNVLLLTYKLTHSPVTATVNVLHQLRQQYENTSWLTVCQVSKLEVLLCHLYLLSINEHVARCKQRRWLHYGTMPPSMKSMAMERVAYHLSLVYCTGCTQFCILWCALLCAELSCTVHCLNLIYYFSLLISNQPIACNLWLCWSFNSTATLAVCLIT